MEQKTLKKLDLKSSKFTANGKEYTIQQEIPLSRYKAYRKLETRLAYGSDSNTMMKNLLKAYNYLNNPKPEPVNAGIIIHNIMNGLKDIEDDSREDPALMICALIILEEGEDPGEFNEALAKEKISNWEKEGYEVSGFFHLALTSLQGFKETFELSIMQTAKTN